MRSRSIRVILAMLLVACAHPKASEEVPAKSLSRRIMLIEHGSSLPVGTRTAYVFDNEPPIIVVSDGKGGPEILYHGVR